MVAQPNSLHQRERQGDAVQDQRPADVDDVGEGQGGRVDPLADADVVDQLLDVPIELHVDVVGDQPAVAGLGQRGGDPRGDGQRHVIGRQHAADLLRR